MVSFTNQFSGIDISFPLFIPNSIERMSLFRYQLSEAATLTLDEDIEFADTEAWSQHVSELIMLYYSTPIFIYRMPSLLGFQSLNTLVTA